MKTKYQYLLIFYWMALLGDCYLIYNEDESNRWITKGLLMPLLIVYYLINSSRKHHLNSKALTILALVLAWAGDLVLLNAGHSVNFVIGLGLFLAMHIVYIIYFWRMHKLIPVTDITTLLVPVLIITVFDFIVIKKLMPYVQAQDPGMVAPLIVYMVVISFMLVMAFNILTSKKANSLALPFFIPGAVLFILSDTLLGFNKFLWNDNLINIGVMLTYGYAQYQLVHGFIKHVKGRI